MYIDFDEMPASARLWWYQADRDLNEQEAAQVAQTLKEKLDTWVTHGMPMRGAFRLYHGRIILLAADVNYQSPSGCSIDSSTRWLQDLGEEMGLNFFDRSFGIWLGDTLHFVPFLAVKKWVLNGDVGPETRVGNTTLAHKGDLDSHFFVPAKETYIKRYFSATEHV